jgi:hypothetical protein
MNSARLRLRGAIAALVTLALCGCAPIPLAMPPNVRIGASTRALPEPRVRGNAAPAAIEAIELSSNDVRRGRTWSGTIVTSTNVASVEIRSNLFSLDVPRQSYGRFAFRVNVFDLPPIFIRAYRLRIIARNSAGASVEEDLPFRFR